MSELKDLSKQRASIRARLTLFEKYLKPLVELKQANISQIEEREITENLFFRLLAQAQMLIDLWTNSDKVESVSAGFTNNLKLPVIKISLYDGNMNQWLEFRDMYLSLIHNNERIDDVTKFHYLKSYLTGSAAAVISSVTVSANNYNIAWSLLCERYNNKERTFKVSMLYILSQMKDY
ncbi:uncharacterized protein LOC131844999 [Achroia grisella]|uniref:uncharacterized protein LOC131844999 n=1 Tax=Achroia grisella TaxID=688607 RepID=UPI0027D27411|nr:uncharacterized protein LOC131844999 [Achroia grisella]